MLVGARLDRREREEQEEPWAAPEAQRSKVPMVTPGSTNPEVTEKGDYIFRLPGRGRKPLATILLANAHLFYGSSDSPADRQASDAGVRPAVAQRGVDIALPITQQPDIPQMNVDLGLLAPVVPRDHAGQHARVHLPRERRYQADARALQRLLAQRAQHREVAGAGADEQDALHPLRDSSSLRSSFLCTLPVVVMGSASMNSISRGYS